MQDALPPQSQDDVDSAWLGQTLDSAKVRTKPLKIRLCSSYRKILPVRLGKYRGCVVMRMSGSTVVPSEFTLQDYACSA